MPYLKGFDYLGDSTITNDTMENVVSLLDYGFIERTGYVSVDIPTTGIYGGNNHQLRVVDDSRYTYGQVWEGFRKNWVWESGVGANVSTNVAYPGVSGVYVDDTFYHVSGTGDYAHHINHPLGRVVFDTAIDTDSTVTCAYSYKYISVSQAGGLNWFVDIHKQSERSDDSDFISNTGEWAILSENRIQLPAVGIEPVNSRTIRPLALGGGSYVQSDFLIHCVTEDSYMRDHLVDIISLLKERNFKAYNLDDIDSSGAFPLDYRGAPVSGALTYPDLVSQYPGPNIRIADTVVDSVYQLTPDIHVGSVKITTESILFGV